MSATGSTASDGRDPSAPALSPPDDSPTDDAIRIFWDDGRLSAHAPDGSLVERDPAGGTDTTPPTEGPAVEDAVEQMAASIEPPADAATAPAGWYADPDDPRQVRYWSGTDWEPWRSPAPRPRSGSGRPGAPLWLQVATPALLLLLAVQAGVGMWPAAGTSCHDHPPSMYPLAVSLSLWLLGVVLALAFLVVSWIRWRRAAIPSLILLGTMVLPVAVAVVGVEDCLA